MLRLLTILLLATLALLPGTAPAFAHKLKVFATAIGASVEGRAYFVGGGPATGVPVTLTDSTGAVAATATTETPDGKFALTLPYRDDFIINADAQDGHVADFQLRATRLAETLPAAPHAAAAATEAQPASAETIAPQPAVATIAIDSEAIEEAVARQIAPLTDQIDEMQASIGLRDMVGGIGYILGIFGLWAPLARRREASK